MKMKMMMMKSVFIFQLSFLCRALQNSTQTNPSAAPASPEDMGSNSDLLVHHLSAKCRFTLRMSGNRSGEAVALTPEQSDLLLDQICQDLGCGDVFEVDKKISPAGVACFSNCVHRDGRLLNCSVSSGGSCTVISAATCDRLAVRLAGGSSRCDGRVELWSSGKWGTVCDDRWDLRDADVVCAQLGCGYAISVTGQGGSYPPGRGPVHLDEMNCTGTEENLWDCPSAQNETDCGHKEDAGVVCSEMRAVRLTGGQDRCSGKVEVHRNGSWGTICDNCWNERVASAVCSMLQCGAKAQKFHQFVPPLKHNEGTLWYYLCGKGDKSLWDCREFANRSNFCSDSKASGVVCEGSLGFPNPTTVSLENITVTSSPTKLVSPAGSSPYVPSRSTILLLSSVTLALLLLVFLVMNTVLCCYYRTRNKFLLQQSRINPRPSSEHHHNSYQDSVNLVKVTTNPSQWDVPSNPRYLWTQLSSVDSTSVDTDYEQFEPSNEPSVPLSTFRNSQRYKTDVNPFVKPSGLDSLFEEAPGPHNEIMGVFTGCNGGPSDAPYARVSKITVDSFDTSSTSSEDENYENTNEGYVTVEPEVGLSGAPAASEPVEPDFNHHQHFSEQTGQPQGSGDGDEDPIYSPVSPDQDTSSEEDYDDIGCLS